MKIAQTFAALALAITITTAANAGSVTVSDPALTAPGGLPLYEFTLDTTGMQGSFDTIELVIEADAGTTLNQEGTGGELVMQPSDDTGFSAFLTAPTNFGGQGLSSFGVDDTTDLSTGISGTFASLGSNDASTFDPYLLAQVVSDGTGTYRYSFFDDGSEVGSGSGIWGIPEPTTLVLAGLSLVGFAGIRRR
ncbi:MAG: PEP-CTERM sorting domain-containing protein [Planctomycetota bacterium]